MTRRHPRYAAASAVAAAMSALLLAACGGGSLEAGGSLDPAKLTISPDNVFQAEVLLKSVLRAGTNNNDLNPVKSIGMLDADPAVLSRLTSATAWWVTTNAPEGLKLLTRRKLTKSMEGDFETDSMRYKATERYETGWTDWRTIFGTPGT